jgi:AcrR family transcriptional regulator
MPRPGKNIEQRLLKSGRQLYAERGGERLTLRALTEHASVNLGMFHYHFKTKEAFLRRLLDEMYEEMFGHLSGRLQHEGPPLQRLREGLFYLACFVREHRLILGRVIADAAAGQQVAVEFLRSNAPRHLALLLALMDQCEREGLLAPTPPLQRFIFIMSGVAMPLLIAPGMHALGVAPKVLRPAIRKQVMSDEAIAQRVDLALGALAIRKGRS